MLKKKIKALIRWVLIIVFETRRILTESYKMKLNIAMHDPKIACWATMAAKYTVFKFKIFYKITVKNKMWKTKYSRRRTVKQINTKNHRLYSKIQYHIFCVKKSKFPHIKKVIIKLKFCLSAPKQIIFKDLFQRLAT